MAPSQSQINPSDHQPHNLSYPTTKTPRCGTSKAQLGLQKILHTILTIPNNPSPPSSSLRINIIENPKEYAPTPETEDPQSPAGAGEGFNDAELEQEKVPVDKEIEDKDGDCMGLLIEAAKMIFGEIKEEEEQKPQSFEDFNDGSMESAGGENKRWTVDLYGDTEAAEPAVRSKRGRTRVLPCKYRDSVLEPLTRVPRNRSTVISTNKQRRLR